MTTQAGGVTVKILGDNSDLQGKLRESANAVAKWGAAAAAAAAAGGAAMVKSGLESADAQAKLAAQLKTTSADLTVLTRAFSMAGVSEEQLRSGTRALTTRLAQAASGAGAAAEELDSLGLSASDLSRVPLSQRIETINRAIEDQVPAAERAASAAKFYGEEAALAFANVSPETIARAAEEIEHLGGALSEIDAAKIEAANDAISRGQITTQAFTQQLAAQFAPVLTGVSDLLYENAAGYDGIQNAAEKAFGFTIKAAGFTADAIRGIQVIIKGLELGFHGFSAVINEVLAVIPETVDEYVVNPVKASINGLIEGMNKLPGIDLETMVIGQSRASEVMRSVAEQAKANFAETKEEMHNLMMEPLPSAALDNFVEAAKAAGQKAAEEAAKAKEESRGLVVPGLDPEAAEENADRVAAAYSRPLQSFRSYGETLTRESKQLNETMEKQAEEAAAAQKKIAEQQLNDRLGIASSMFGNLASLMNTENRKLFEAGKIAAISQAVIDGISAAVSSYKAGAAIGGPILGAAYATTSAIATGAQIAQLSSATYGGGGGGAGAAAAAGGGVSEASAPVQGQQAAGPSSDSTLFLENVNPDAMYTGATLQRLVERIKEFEADGGGKVILI